MTKPVASNSAGLFALYQSQEPPGSWMMLLHGMHASNQGNACRPTLVSAWNNWEKNDAPAEERGPRRGLAGRS